MFFGGTSFGFMNGANKLPVFPSYAADVSSYGNKQVYRRCFQPASFLSSSSFADYDAPLSEAGDYSDKYLAAKNLVARYNTIPNLYMPAMPAESIKTAYPPIEATQHLTLFDLLAQVVMKIYNPFCSLQTRKNNLNHLLACRSGGSIAQPNCHGRLTHQIGRAHV